MFAAPHGHGYLCNSLFDGFKTLIARIDIQKDRISLILQPVPELIIDFGCLEPRLDFNGTSLFVQLACCTAEQLEYASGISGHKSYFCCVHFDTSKTKNGVDIPCEFGVYVLFSSIC